MAGGGGSGPFHHRTPEELADLVRKAEEKTADAAFETALSGFFAELLGAFNSRDVPLVRDRLDRIKSILKDKTEGTYDQLFGGSVAKNTFVDGLSDIDSLLIVNDSEFEGAKPKIVLEEIGEILRHALGKDADITVGHIAVTCAYADGMEIQLLPAIRANRSLRIPLVRGNDWAQIDPEGFQKALTRRNDECNQKLIPTIKLAKAINSLLPDRQRLTGYHIESLAIAAFRDYAGTKTTNAMLPAFFEAAKQLVLTPIRDSTGQSIHVDDYLGPANNDARVGLSHVLGRFAKRMRNATAFGSIAQWRELFGLEQ